ncbi:MAG: family transposase [Candidatus Poribacteria bacterium]|nr:family transposase [Candidatus Poribacteria bacterium]
MKLFVGIDASLRHNQCCFVDHKGKKIMQLNVSNNLSGAQELERNIDQKALELDVEDNLSPTHSVLLQLLSLRSS